MGLRGIAAADGFRCAQPTYAVYKPHWEMLVEDENGIMPAMTKLLEQAIEQVRELPAENQDSVADALFAYIANEDRPAHLTIEQVEEVKRRQKALHDGKTRLATDEEVAAVWKRCGL